MLEIDDLSVTYRKGSDALKGVNLKLHKGKAVVVGPNGSGKTTLLRATLGLAPISRGRVRVFGLDVQSIRTDTRLSTNVLEVYRLARLRVKDIISLYAELKGADPAQSLKMIDDFELGGILSKWIYELSSGQQKLLGNILALSFEPRLCLLDEPFDQVDQSRRLRLAQLLRDFPGEVLLNTHEFGLLDRLGDSALYFMIEGRLFGSFELSQLTRLYISRGEVAGALVTLDTSYGKFSVTLDRGEAAITTSTSLERLLEAVA